MRILVPTDGSPASRRAVRRGRELACATGADLRICPVRGSAVAAAVRRRAEAEGADLIVVARMPSWGGRLQLLGSVAEELACHAPCSVLVEPPDPDGGRRSAGDGAAVSGSTEIRSILVPVDFSAASGEALARALWLGRALGARVELLHVLPPARTGDRRASDPAPRALREAMERFEDRASSMRDRRVPMGRHVRRGAPARAIARFAREGSYDLVIVGARGRSRVPGASLGRVAQELLWRAPGPVMVVKRGGHDDEPTANGGHHDAAAKGSRDEAAGNGSRRRRPRSPIGGRRPRPADRSRWESIRTGG